MPKKLGGLGVLDIKDLNQALLSKWIWQWYKQDEKLWKSIITALYVQEGIGLRQSHFFRSQLKGVAQFCECFMMRRLGDGSTISFWDEDWGKGTMKSCFTSLHTFAWHSDVTVKQVLSALNIENLFRLVLTQREAGELQFLIQIIEHTRRMVSQGVADDVIWKGCSKGAFYVRSAYYMLKNGPRVRSSVHKLWNLTATPRFKIFGWLLLLNKVLTTENLNKRGFNLVSICYMCRANEETTMHLFNDCVFVKQMCDRIFRFSFPQYNVLMREDIKHMALLVDKGRAKEIRELMLIILFVLWRERCTRLFQERFKTVEELT